MSKKPEVTAFDDGDEVIQRVREARHRISERFGHDPYRLVAHYMELQKAHSDQIVPSTEPKVETKILAE